MPESVMILAPALLAGILVLASHVSLGRQVLSRGIIFIDLAVAQAAATGALLAMMLLDHAETWHTELFAGSAALLMALLLHQLEKQVPHIQEALIGGSFVTLASVAALVTSQDAHGSEHIQSLLEGQILWTDKTMLLILAIASAVSIVAQLQFRHPLARFYLPFALAITAAVQAVGVYLVFASLIFPALATRNLPGIRGVITGILLGTLCYAVGLAMSLWFDWPSGPAVVAALAVVCSLILILIPQARAPRSGRE